MDFDRLVGRVVDDGIVAAQEDYSKPEDKEKLEGSLKGFEECRGKDLERLSALLAEAKAKTREKLAGQANDYWYWRCREAEVEWVCDVVSAALVSAGRGAIVLPTARGYLKLAEMAGKEQGLLAVGREARDG